MKFKLSILTLLTVSLISINIIGQSVTINGNAFLESQSNHQNIRIVFERIVPSTLFDTTYTNSSGAYEKEIEEGIYNIYFSHEAYLPDSITEEIIYSNKTLPDITLENIGLNGSLSGILYAGFYKVGGDISVSEGNELIIEPGVTLSFVGNTEFIISGNLQAIGNLYDSIKFTNHDIILWDGIKLNSNSNAVISYILIEGSHDKGMEIYQCNPTISNSLFKNNTGHINEYDEANKGGGIYLENSQATLENLVFTNNYALRGAALHAESSEFAAYNCEFYNNQSYSTAAIHIEENTLLELNNSFIYDNEMLNWTQWNPSGLFIKNSQLCTRNSIIRNNLYGGIRVINSSYFKSINSIYFNNNGYSQYLNDTVGYGLSIDDEAYVNIINTTIANHKSYGIHLHSTDNASIINSCIWNNLENFSGETGYFGQLVTTNVNGDSCDAYQNIIMNSLFSDPENFNYSLAEDSPCIDAGNNDSIYFAEDILNNHRIFDGNNDGIAIVDIGPYEYGAQPIININRLESKNLFKIFPNPCKNQMYIENLSNSDIQYTIYDLSGRSFKTGIIDNNSIKTLQLTSFPQGIYFIRLSSDNNMTTKKIIIQ